jgi:hypothetical protein
MTSRQAIRGAMQQGERVARATGRVGALGVHAGGTHAGRGVVIVVVVGRAPWASCLPSPGQLAGLG